MNTVHQRPACRAIAMVLLVCALSIRVLVPSGFMLSPSARGAPILVICSGQGPVPAAMEQMAMAAMGPVAMSEHQAPGHDGKQSMADHPCAFAPAGAAAHLTAAVHPASPVLAPIALVALWRPSLRPGLGLAAPPPPKTGPPSSH